MAHRYYYRNRPHGMFGTEPEGWTRFETWRPRQEAQTPPLPPRAFWGWVEYSRPLTEEELYRFELWPGDTKELLAHLVRQRVGQDRDWIIEDYWQQEDSLLVSLVGKGDFLAQLIAWAKEFGLQLDELVN